jgi:hypothetical protein
MIPSKKFGEKRPQIDESSDERKSSKNSSENRRKRKRWEQRIWHKIEKEDFTMNILAKSGYKPLIGITNLGWQKAQQRVTLTSLPFFPRAPQNETSLPPLAIKLAGNSGPSYI